MHILAGLLAVAGIVFFVLWRLRNAAAAAQDVIEVADDVRAAMRRFGFRQEAHQNPLDGIEDPRIAAAGILAAFAYMDSAFSQAEIAGIEAACAEAFDCDAEEARHLCAYGRWLVQQSQGNMGEVIRRLARNLEGRLTAQERRQLLGMVETLARIDGGEFSEAQEDSYRRLEQQLVA